MFRNLRLTAVAALAAAVLFPSLADAATYHSRSSGDSATATFSSVDPTGCIWTFTDVYVYENRFRTEPGPSQPQTWLDLFAYSYDYCQYTSSYELFASTYIPNEDFRMSGGLQSATLQTTFDNYNWLTGAYETVTVNLAWAGEGDVFRGHSNNQNSGPGYRYMSRSNGSYRAAAPSGSVTVGSTSLVAGAQYVSGSLASSQSAFTTIIRSN